MTMTRSELNQVLIDAVKASAVNQSHTLSLKTFVEVDSINVLNDRELAEDALSDPGSEYYYSHKASITGNGQDYEFPVLMVIEEDVDARHLLSKNKGEWVHNLQIVVAFPNQLSQDDSPGGMKHLHRKELTDLCTQMLGYVMHYVGVQLDNDPAKASVYQRMKTLNQDFRISTNPDFAGFGVAWTQLRFPQCVKYNSETYQYEAGC